MGRIFGAACGPKYVGSSCIQPLWGVSVPVRYGGMLHREERWKASPCIPTRVGASQLLYMYINFMKINGDNENSPSSSMKKIN